MGRQQTRADIGLGLSGLGAAATTIGGGLQGGGIVPARSDAPATPEDPVMQLTGGLLTLPTAVLLGVAGAGLYAMRRKR